MHIKREGQWQLLFNNNGQLRAITNSNTNFIGLVGEHTAKSIYNISNALAIDQQDFAFIFPGNESHHTDTTTLYSKKSGDNGLRKLAGELHDNLRAATLSLPVPERLTGTDAEKENKMKLAKQDLWRAVGHGHTIMVPLQPTEKGNFQIQGMEYDFSTGLKEQYGDELKSILDHLNEEENLDLSTYSQDEYLRQGKNSNYLTASGITDGWYDKPTAPKVQFKKIMKAKPRSHLFMDNFNGYTSDHAERTAKVEYVNPESNEVELTANVMTWNLMNKCRGASEKIAYPNNPLNVTESIDDYMLRKAHQIDHLMRRIAESRYSNNETLDFILLQEVDFLVNPHPKENQYLIAAKAHLLKYFTNQLKKVGQVGYGMVVQQGKDRKPLVTLYNKANWILLANSKSPVLDDSGLASGLEARFQSVKNLAHTISVTNVHLDFKTDYTDSIEQYQKERVKQGVFSIMAGDTNHPQNHQTESMVVNWHYVSNVSGEKQKDGSYRMSDEQKVGDKTYKKAYDGFFVSPTEDTYARITETQGTYFELDKENNTCTPLPLPEDRTHKVHTSEIGQPWKRTKYMLLDLDKQIGDEKDEAKKQALIEKQKDLFTRRMTQEDFEAYAKSRLPNAAKTLGLVKDDAEFEAVRDATSVKELLAALKDVQENNKSLTNDQKKEINELKANVLNSIFNKEQTELFRLKTQAKKFVKWGFFIVPLFIALVYAIRAVIKSLTNTVKAFDLKPKASDGAKDGEKPAKAPDSFSLVNDRLEKEALKTIKTKSGKVKVRLRKSYTVNSETKVSVADKDEKSNVADSKHVRVFLTAGNNKKKFVNKMDDKGFTAVKF